MASGSVRTEAESAPSSSIRTSPVPVSLPVPADAVPVDAVPADAVPVDAVLDGAARDGASTIDAGRSQNRTSTPCPSAQVSACHSGENTANGQNAEWAGLSAA